MDAAARLVSMTTVNDVAAAIESLWPVAGARDGDVVGLTAGNRDAAVQRILLAVDPVGATVDEAVELGADVILAHHPLLMRAVNEVSEDAYKGALLAKLIKADIALFAAHTNADVVERGTSGMLATALGLRGVTPIDADRGPGEGAGAQASTGIGRVGELPESVTLGALARTLAGLLPETATGVRVAGPEDALVQRVALCGGSGDSLLGHPAVVGADVYLTADLRHHPASEAKERALRGAGPWLIDMSHWASEWLWLEAAAEQLRVALPGVEVYVSSVRTDAWDFLAR
ncbi:MAG: Nif3-like dinuclear metal center hexameric protein [Microthrixaceae bacterium]|nr:Nif3-like dinuclear metal center hexameric protein [Microthrixaceae bacterium]